MVEITTFETTKKLLNAEFPRSEDWGQQYYIESKGNSREIGGIVLGNGSSDTIRAMTALDILKHLGDGFNLYWTHMSKWCCSTYHAEYSTCLHENSAEAVAEMYLKVNQCK